MIDKLVKGVKSTRRFNLDIPSVGTLLFSNDVAAMKFLPNLLQGSSNSRDIRVEEEAVNYLTGLGIDI